MPDEPSLGLSTTAIGGTQTARIYKTSATDPGYVPFVGAFAATDAAGASFLVDHGEGNVVTVRGLAAGTDDLRIAAPETDEEYGRTPVRIAPIDSVELYTGFFEGAPRGGKTAWFVGRWSLGVLLIHRTPGHSPPEEWLVDESTRLSLAGATQTAWDTLVVPSIAPGTYPITVAAGDQPPRTLDLVVVDHLDRVIVEPAHEANVGTAHPAEACFQAITGDRFVVKVDWHFVVNHVEREGLGNCVFVTAADAMNGTIEVVGSAAGRSATATLTVAAAGTDHPVPVRSRPTPPGPTGDRAASM